MNNSQKQTIIGALSLAGSVLLLIFVRIGAGFKYKDSIMIYPMGTETRPYPYDSGDWPTGLLIRMGGFGVIVGVMIPLTLFAIAIYLYQSEK